MASKNIELDLKSIKLWAITIAAIIPTVVGGVSKGIEIIRYNILDRPHNEDEAFGRHRTEEHFQPEVKQVMQPIDMGKFIIEIFTYEDDNCVVVKRVDKEGYVPYSKMLPHPDTRKRLTGVTKNNYVMSEAFAAGPSFTFGVHVNDANFTEQFFKTGYDVRVKRTYGDGCELEYYINVYGSTYGWYWITYKH